MSRNVAFQALVLFALHLGCGRAEPPLPPPSAPAAVARRAEAPLPPPTLEELKNATYRGIDLAGGPVTLVEGAASRPTVTFVRDFRVTGDLDGDGSDEAVILLAAASGGSGTFNYVAVAKRGGQGIENVGTAPLGDRVQLRRARIEDRRLLLDVVQAGPKDAACCPGELVTRGFSLGRNGLTEFVSAGAGGRLTIDVIGGAEWVLRWWSWDEKVPDTSEATLSLVEGRLAGSGGCNRYFAAAKRGEMPGDLTLGPIGSTQMACPEPIASFERRFLTQLGNVRKLGFLAGMLALSYESDGAMGVMLFEAR
jgi:heat shock protein HslJ